MQLFKDKKLNIAILISASCHLICMFSIMPILVSGVVRKEETIISFLGSILEKVSAIPERTFGLQEFSNDRNREIYRHIGLEALDLTPPKNLSEILSIRPDKEKSILSEKKHNIVTSHIHHSKKKSSKIEFKDFTIIGQAKNRAILYKPPMPTLPVLDSYFSSDYSVSIRFRVSGHGFIEQPERIVSSGSSEVDSMAIRYIRKWQFVPYHEERDVVREGIIRLSFDAS